MSVTTFGDLAGMASRYLGAAAALADGDLASEDVAAAVRPLRRMALTLSRFLGDVAAYDEAEAITSMQLSTWIRAVVDAREALRLAADGLRPLGAPVIAGEASAGTLTASLDTAATALAAGRDLLRAHLFTAADGAPLARSGWAAVVTSAPVTMALLNETARWSQQLAFLSGRLSVALAAEPAGVLPVHRGLASTCYWLVIAEATIRSGQRTAPAGSPDTALLMAIPGRSVPQRRPPRAPETTAELCQGAVTSATRLRAIAHQAAGQAASSAQVTAESLRWMATAAAVTCHISENILRLLAGRADHAAPDTETRLHDAAESAARACASWRTVTAAWSQLTTETTGLVAPGIPDAGDLIVRLGRLAFADAEWTPLRARHARLRDPADLACQEEQGAVVIAAVHHAADTLASVAAADTHAVGTAIRAHRLYAPTRTLPECMNVPYRYGHAAQIDTAALLKAYQAAAEATTLAAAGLDTIAIGLNAPSQVLAAARAATARGRAPHADHDVSRLAGAQPAGPAAGAPSGNDPPPIRLPGPAEQAVRGASSRADPFLLLRAQAIDTAARQLIAQTQRAARRPAERTPTRKRPPSQTAGAAAQRAAENFPAALGGTVSGRARVSAAAETRPPSIPLPPGPGSGGRVTQVSSGGGPDAPRQRG